MELLYGDIEKLGKIFGKEAEAEKTGFRTGKHSWRRSKRISNNGDTRVFLYDSGEDKPFTAGKFAMPAALISEAGGTNIMSDMKMSWATTSWETVAARNPQFLILLDYQDDAGYRSFSIS